MAEISELPPDLTRVLYDLGPRKLVLLEGISDVAIFREWYRDRRDQIEFFAPEVPQGTTGVRALFSRMLARSVSPNPREYGIVDRDFHDQAEVQAALADPEAHLFILGRYCIENYLLEPLAVSEEVRVLSGPNTISLSAQEMESRLLEMCRQLKTLMAANWVMAEAQRGKHFAEGHEIIAREAVIKRIAKELECSQEDAELALAAKEELIEPMLFSLETAYRHINGKHLLFLVHKTFVKTGVQREPLRNLLARDVKEKVGLHEDIKTIVERRVLA